MDASHAQIPPYGIERIKATQFYLQSSQITQLLVVGENKLNRLAMLLLFNQCRPKLNFIHNLDQAQWVLAKPK